MFTRPNGSVTGSILVADLPESGSEPAKRRGRPRKAATTPEVAANPEPQPEPEPEPEPEPQPEAEEAAT